MTASTERASPLAGWAARFDAASAQPEAFSIREIAFASQLNLRGDASSAAFAGPVTNALCCALPLAANTVSEGYGSAALWLGPHEWLLVAPEGRNSEGRNSEGRNSEGRNETLYALLTETLRGLHHSLTDVSASRTLIEISGEHARLVLAKGCPLDLHGSRFAPRQCAQTLLAKSQVILQCVDVRPTFRIFVRISFAPYLAEWLTDAAAELAASAGVDHVRLETKLA